jgi:hypothetical protein
MLDPDALPFTLRAEGPGPVMSMFVDKPGKALARVIVPVTEGAKAIVSWVASRSACSIAARSVPGPVSPVLVAMIVESMARLSIASTTHRFVRRRGRPDPRFFECPILIESCDASRKKPIPKS